MVGFSIRRDPWWEDGRGARRTRLRKQLVSMAAFAIAIVACGLTTAAWLRVVLPALGFDGLV
jgi:hypothetical protein